MTAKAFYSVPSVISSEHSERARDKYFFKAGAWEEVINKIVQRDGRIKNLEDEVKNGNFRKDLFYRIHVIPVTLPALRERKEDIPLLVDHFLKKFSESMNKATKEITMAAMQKLLSYSWPGNVRELENTIEYAFAMSARDVIDQDLILQTNAPDTEELKSFKDAKNNFEKNYISNLLSLAEGNVSKAAKIAGKYRGDLYALIKKHELDPSIFKK